MAFELTSEQQQALDLYKVNMFLVVNGGPGVGKTTLIQRLYDFEPDERRLNDEGFFETYNWRTLVIAPTGSAAARITSLNKPGLEGHVFQRVTFTDKFLERYVGKNVILDEGSMMDAYQFCKLITCLKPKRLCIVADKDQLKPIGEEASVIGGLIASSHVPRVSLTINHRQNSHDSALYKTICALRDPLFKTPCFQDETLRIYLCVSDAEAIQKASVKFASDITVQMLGFTNPTVNKLNRLTENLNMNRIVCGENYYDDDGILQVANGVTGMLLENGNAVYNNGFIDEKKKNGKMLTVFEPARAMTVHKAQGNEFAALGIVVVTTWGQPTGLRELIYTALSRFKSQVVIFGTHRMVKSCFESKFDDRHVELVCDKFADSFSAVEKPRLKKRTKKKVKVSGQV